MAKKKRKPRYTAYPGEEKTVVCVLIDTCVWIDFATEPRDQQLMWVLEGLVRERFVELLVPQIVLDEWNANREKTLKKGRERMTSALRGARWAVQQQLDRLNPQRAQTSADLAVPRPTRGLVSRPGISSAPSDGNRRGGVQP